MSLPNRPTQNSQGIEKRLEEQRRRQEKVTTAFAQAISGGFPLERLELFFRDDPKPDLSIPIHNGKKVIHIATDRNRFDVVKFLVDTKGANINEPINDLDDKNNFKNNWTPLDQIMCIPERQRKDYSELLVFMQEHKAEQRKVVTKEIPALPPEEIIYNKLIKACEAVTIDEMQKQFTVGLMELKSCDSTKVVALLEKRGDLIFTCINHQLSGDFEAAILEEIAKLYKTYSVDMNLQNPAGMNAFMLFSSTLIAYGALEKDHPAVLKIASTLLNCGVNPTMKDCVGRTARDDFNKAGNRCPQGETILNLIDSRYPPKLGMNQSDGKSDGQPAPNDKTRLGKK